MGILKEFREFAIKGNVIDLAVGVVIGSAFSKIISSFIDDIITPVILKPALQAAKLSNLEELTIFGTVKYGSFISTILYFIIIAFALFFVIKGVNAANKKSKDVPAPPAEPTNTEKLLMEIRDSLKK